MDVEEYRIERVLEGENPETEWLEFSMDLETYLGYDDEDLYE